MLEFLFYFFFFVLPFLCLAGYVYEHWWIGGNSICLMEFMSMMFIAAVPVANLIVLACVFDIPDKLDHIVVFKARNG